MSDEQKENDVPPPVCRHGKKGVLVKLDDEPRYGPGWVVPEFLGCTYCMEAHNGRPKIPYQPGESMIPVQGTG